MYWSYRGEKMPKVSKALADVFFDAFVGNGNVRYLPSSEPVAVHRDRRRVVPVASGPAAMVAAGCPPETTQLEFTKTLLHRLHRRGHSRSAARRIGVPLVTGGTVEQEAHRA